MRGLRRLTATLAVTALVVSACSGGASPSPATSSAPADTAAPSAAAATPIPGGLLDTVLKAGVLVVSTDPAYPPQSELAADGTYQGFDIDVATEIAKRMGVGIKFETPSWDAITAGGWGGRWNASVGSMTITVDRSKVLDFSVPYYYTPAQMAASTVAGITTLDDLAGKTVCTGVGTTYYQWLEGTLDYGDGQDLGTPPAGVKATTLKTDRDCAVQWQSRRFDFEGWLSSSTTVEQAVQDGLPLVKVGDPVFYEPLAVATDKSGPDTSDFMVALNKIITDMHEDGTLTALSMKWFKADYTVKTQ